MAGANHVLGFTRTHNGGTVWDSVQQITTNCSQDVDKPSIEVSDDGSKAWVAYICNAGASGNTVAVTYWDGSKWNDENVDNQHTHLNSEKKNPIIRKNEALPGVMYVAFQEVWLDSMANAHRDVVLEFSSDGGLHFGLPEIPPSTVSLDTDNPVHGTNGLVRNDLWYSIAVDPQGTVCDIVYEQQGSVFFTQSSGASGTWTMPASLGSNLGGMQFQPNVAIAPTKTAVTFYQQPTNLSNTHVYAVVSTNGGSTWGPLQELTDLGSSGFSPCVDTLAGGYFGDYTGLVPLATSRTDSDDRFYAAWADSRLGCVNGTNPQLHQHTMGVLFN